MTFPNILNLMVFRVAVRCTMRHKLLFSPLRLISTSNSVSRRDANAQTQNTSTNCFPTFRKLCVLKCNGARRRAYVTAAGGNNKDLFEESCPCGCMHNCTLSRSISQTRFVAFRLKVGKPSLLPPFLFPIVRRNQGNSCDVLLCLRT
jgi:hypothetical protein